jgi:hypothetical protein
MHAGVADFFWVVMCRHFPVCLLAARPGAQGKDEWVFSPEPEPVIHTLHAPIPRGENVRVYSSLSGCLCSCICHAYAMQEQQQLRHKQMQLATHVFTRADSIDDCSS